jgi:hypothetical protein
MKGTEQFIKVKQAMADFESFVKSEILSILNDHKLEYLEFNEEVLPTMVSHYARHHVVVVEITGVEIWTDHVEVLYINHGDCHHCSLSKLSTVEQYQLLQTVANSFKK